MSSLYAPVPTLPSSSHAEPKSGPYPSEAHCSHTPARTRDLVQDVDADRPSISSISALELAQLINDPGEIINASYPRLSALLDDAEASLTAKRIDELSVQLEQASKLLQELVADLLPNIASEQQGSEPLLVTQTVPEPDVPLADVPAERTAITDISARFEHRRMMAMAA